MDSLSIRSDDNKRLRDEPLHRALDVAFRYREVSGQLATEHRPFAGARAAIVKTTMRSRASSGSTCSRSIESPHPGLSSVPQIGTVYEHAKGLAISLSPKLGHVSHGVRRNQCQQGPAMTPGRDSRFSRLLHAAPSIPGAGRLIGASHIAEGRYLGARAASLRAISSRQGAHVTAIRVALHMPDPEGPRTSEGGPRSPPLEMLQRRRRPDWKKWQGAEPLVGRRTISGGPRLGQT